MSSIDVDRKLDSMWHDGAEREHVRGELEKYGRERHEVDVARVHLAILKLCEGASAKVAELVAAAKNDYRDVLMWAEYPSEGRALWTAQSNLTSAQREELARIREEDRKQYRKWLKE